MSVPELSSKCPSGLAVRLQIGGGGLNYSTNPKRSHLVHLLSDDIFNTLQHRTALFWAITQRVVVISFLLGKKLPPLAA